MKPTLKLVEPKKLKLNVDENVPEIIEIGRRNTSVTGFVIVNLLQAPIINTPSIIDQGCGSLTVTFSDNINGNSSYIWEFAPTEFSFLPNPTYTYPDTGTYFVLLTAENQHGCVSDFQIKIIITPAIIFDIPNAFVPNPDGGNGGTYDINSLSNTVFFPRTEYVEEFNMLIFNRWGELIFESNDINIGWDGYYRGEISAQDAYVWKIEATFLDGTKLNKIGDLTLIR